MTGGDEMTDEELKKNIRARREFREQARAGFEQLVDIVCDHLDKVDEAQADSLFQLNVTRSALGRIADSLPDGCESQAAELRELQECKPATEGAFTRGALKWLCYLFALENPPNYLRWPLFADEERLDVTVSRHNGLSTDEMLAFERAKVQRLEARIRELEAEASS